MFKKITLLSIFLTVNFLFSQTVTTVSDGNFYDGIGQDSLGNIYCSDFSGDSVFKYSIEGIVTTFASGFSSPNGIGVNEQDEIFICDASANTIFKYSLNGTLITNYTIGINNPTGIKNIPGTTDMLIVEYNNDTLKRLTLDGTISTLFSGFPLNGPSGIAFINGETFISNYDDRKIMRFKDRNMTLLNQLPATAPNNNVLGFLTASNDQLYATLPGAHQIYTINPISGNATLYAGSIQGSANGDISAATFNFPNGILADTANNRIYVSDAGTSNLRIIENVTLSTSEFETNTINLSIFADRKSDMIGIKANLNSSEKINIKIYEITGKQVFSKDYSVSNLAFFETINKNTFNSGTYIVLFTQDNVLSSKKITL
ncbi:T9SS type A sorting domain-containing protein [uncultured Aquimarina sp.]|uniref:T9SS type A sorting domain-containing protein n=1 Tax=uncultured Aquimarina sp. TaxID=575652 RepID=UPI00260EDF9C|nr:T9SS type A sorting domain-containing protein [uncultured Aquimarina sp.]